MYYQGPVINPSVEVNMAFGGEIMSDVRKSTEGALADVLGRLYRPKTAWAHRKLVEILSEQRAFTLGSGTNKKSQKHLKGQRRVISTSPTLSALPLGLPPTSWNHTSTQRGD
jgi:hypothetical protein